MAEVITGRDLVPDKPLKKSCGTCMACMPVCPIAAIVAPYLSDNSGCIPYYTIENRGTILREFRSLMGDWVFGCDIC